MKFVWTMHSFVYMNYALRGLYIYVQIHVLYAILWAKYVNMFIS
jgi:hypothetical protein